MRIDEYYRNTAKISLNASIAALLPAAGIVVGNLSFFHHQQIMLFTIPFFIYSLLCFQIYLGKIKQAILIEKNLMNAETTYRSLFETDKLLVLFINTFSPQLLVFFPDGYVAAVIKKCKDKKTISIRKKNKAFALLDFEQKLIGYYVIQGKRQVLIEVYDQNREYLGCFEKRKIERMKKTKKEVLDNKGRFVGAVEGSAYYLDEQIMDPHNRLIVRLRRGWMPLEWSSSFPEPNTPVLSFSNRLNDKDKILQMSFLVNEFFLER